MHVYVFTMPSVIRVDEAKANNIAGDLLLDVMSHLCNSQTCMRGKVSSRPKHIIPFFYPLFHSIISTFFPIILKQSPIILI